jgi:hypothetical protein
MQNIRTARLSTNGMNQQADTYEQDIDAWIDTQVRLLKQRRLHEIDVAHLIEELQDMGKSNRRELESRLIILIAHLLKWRFQLQALSEQWREFEGKSWRNTIIEQRAQILFLLRKVPSLKPLLDDAVAEAYPEARNLAARETGLEPDSFPKRAPFTVAEILDQEYYPPSQDMP